MNNKNKINTNLPLPYNEKERLEALKSYNILDTLPESVLDSITKLASNICKTPIALISLIDENRQWFKSNIGLKVSETPRDISFCQYAIMNDIVYEVKDATKNKLFVNNPLVTHDPKIRFYAGAPLTDPDGNNLGTLCVINTVPGQLTDEQKESLQLLANSVVAHVRLQKNNAELKESKRVLRNFFDLSPDFMCTASAEGFFLNINQSFTRKLGYSKEELLNKSFFHFIHPDDFQNTLNELKNLKNGESTIEFENRYRKNDGSYIWVSWNASPDKVNGLIYATARDVTEQKNAQVIIGKSEESLNRAQSIAKIGSWEFNLSTFDLTWSKEHYKIFELEEMPSDKLYEAYKNKIHPDDIPQLDLNVKNAIEKGEGFTYEHRVICKNGTIKYVVGIGEACMDEHGKPVILRGTVQDITERVLSEQKIKESEESLNNAQQISKTGSWEFNLENNELKWSKELYRIFEMEEAPAADLFELCRKKIYPEDIALLDKAISFAIENGEAMNLEHRIVSYDGSIKHLLGIGKVYKNEKGKSILLRGTVQDVTESKRIERELIRSKELAEQAVIAKNSFLANMSHEIRTPMNAIIGFTDLLGQTRLDNVQNEFVESVRNAGENLLSIINDILDFSKIESGKLSIEEQPFKIRETFKNIHKLLKVKADEKQLQFVLNIDKDVPDVVCGDCVRLTQIMINLAGNSIKFTESGCISINVTKSGRGDSVKNINFSVKDTGIGIPEDKLETIFERFTQVNNETHRKYGGTGLGLSISKSLVELMGGTLKVTSAINRGSEFSFGLKFHTAGETNLYTKSKEVVVRKHLGHSAILVFEDNMLNQRLVKNVLNNFGFEVELASNGKAGLECLMKSSYDVILMDLQMPDLDGYMVTDAIRNDLKIKTPIIAMTAHSMSGEREKCLSYGMNDYLSKPFKQEELFQKISDLLFKISELIEIDNYDGGHSIKKSYNLDYLRELSAGNKGFEKEMIEIFISKVSTDIELLSLALDRKDYKAVKDQAHELISSLPIAGLTDLEPSLKEVEIEAGKKIINKETYLKFEKIKVRLNECFPELKKVLIEEYN